MSALFAAALLACMQDEAQCVIAEDGPIGRIYICGLPTNGSGQPATFGFQGFDGRYSVTIAPECRDA